MLLPNEITLEDVVVGLREHLHSKGVILSERAVAAALKGQVVDKLFDNANYRNNETYELIQVMRIALEHGKQTGPYESQESEDLALGCIAGFMDIFDKFVVVRER